MLRRLCKESGWDFVSTIFKKMWNMYLLTRHTQRDAYTEIERGEGESLIRKIAMKDS